MSAGVPPRTWAVIAGGGTAGHVLPGLSVARELVRRGHDADTIHFVNQDDWALPAVENSLLDSETVAGRIRRQLG